MAKPKDKQKTIELWDGYEVEVKEQLLDDFDYVSDLSKAQRDNDIEELMSMYFALVGGQEVYDKVREHIEAETGHFSLAELRKIIKKIDTLFPKAGNRAERRHW